MNKPNIDTKPLEEAYDDMGKAFKSCEAYAMRISTTVGMTTDQGAISILMMHLSAIKAIVYVFKDRKEFQALAKGLKVDLEHFK